MITDQELDRESPEDIPFVLALDFARRVSARANSDPSISGFYGSRSVQELALQLVDQKLISVDGMATVLRDTADYLLKNVKS
jgi:hypothetical protein